MGDSDQSTLSKLLAKPRVHFGSLEEHEVAKRIKVSEASASSSGIDLDALMESGDADLSETSIRAKEANRQVMEELERRKRARQLAVPTDDVRVRLRLREIGEPQCLFGEGPGDRRDRLRFLLSKREGRDVESESESSDEDDEEKEEEFFTPGSMSLLEARKWMTTYSLPRAKLRIERQKAEQELPLAQLKAERKELHTKLKAFTSWSSQLADDERLVSQCAFSPDSKMLVTGSWSGVCKLWSIPNCEELMTFKGHTDRVGGVAFRPGATIDLEKSVVNLASGGADSVINLWSLDKDTPLSTLEGHVRRVARVAFHPSGRYLGSAGYDGTWRLWDVERSEELLLQEGHSKEVYAIAFQCDGSLVASGGLDSIGRVWDTRTGRSAMTLEGHVNNIVGLDWSPNGYHLASASGDNTVKIWDMRTLRNIYTISAHQSLVSDVKYSKGDGLAGLYMTTVGYDGCVKLWSGDDYRLIKSLEGHEGKVMGVDVSNDGNFVASSGSDRTFKLWADENLII
ncbi:U4/U6 small nuclear ribonucleoprotein Prp4 [Apophysomyces sp. BC1034]|nr:U4/U6 small nuclear ribonucleoprotein Prp4 [Apophysomyces sp. BC1015]KAG0190199.1 U4/U6 small nuclear ribonucleoprotein Prp4 [Apophysomyces sp. BC1034]